MKTHIKILIVWIALSVMTGSCRDRSEEPANQTLDSAHGVEEVHLSQHRFDGMNMKVDSISKRIMGEYVETTGILTVPPQNEASVTAIVGGNVESIAVIEGEDVRRGQPLAYLSHPDLINLQTEFMRNSNELEFLEKDYLRKKTLYSEQVGSGKEFQKTESDFKVARAKVKGYEAQLKIMGLDPKRILGGNLYERIPVPAPIDGSIRQVNIKTGQYVRPETEMFSIVNNDHIHADFMVFEKDVPKVREGQIVRFTLGADPKTSYTSEIFSVGKSFEQNPKAVHIHADIRDKANTMLPGMFIRGKIYTDSTFVYALPRDGVVNEAGTHFIFLALPPADDSDEWIFRPLQVSVGLIDGDWMEVKVKEPLSSETKVAWNNAYYLMAEMHKGEAEHH